ncbi:MAG: hypothetical protein QM286_11475 [Acidobacteriota bacterium]|nr:hypothetical protein [Acidobacteriota bacterium]
MTGTRTGHLLDRNEHAHHQLGMNAATGTDTVYEELATAPIIEPD